MTSARIQILAVAAICAFLALPPSQALTSINVRGLQSGHFSSAFCLDAGAKPRSSTCLLRAVAENRISAEACSEADGSDIPNGLDTPPIVTAVAGPGARITSVSSGVAVEQRIWESEFDEGSFDNIAIPDNKNNKVGSPRVCEDEVVADYNPFSNDRFQGRQNQPVYDEQIITEITNESESSDDTASNSKDLDDNEAETTEDPNNEKESSNNGDDSDNSVIRSAIAKSALLHRAGIAGTAKKSSRSNGRSSNARTHVNKSRRGSGRAQGVGSLSRVLGTVRTAAAAAATEQKKSLDKNGGETKPGENNAKGNNNMINNNNALNLDASSSGWKNAVDSAVSDMLKHQDALIQQQSLGGVTQYTQSTNIDSLPPGTASMGLLGEVVQEKLPTIPPLPGAFLVRTNGDIPTTKPQITIRSSIPHSADDKHIANLRLSVFSRFDKEQQRIFRNRSVEVLNVRRRRGAVVLVADVSKEWSKETGRENEFPNDMEARIKTGHKYGDIATVAHEAYEDSSPSLTVTPIGGAKITSVSYGVTVEHNIKKKNVQMSKGSIIGSIECSHQEFRGTMLGNSRPKGALMYVTEVAVRTDARRCGAGAMLMKGVDEVAALRNVETIYLHVDVTNQAACTLYEKCGFHYLDKLEPIYAQFTASLNLHDGAMHGRKHYLMCKNRTRKTTWLEEDDLFSETRKGALGWL